MIINRIHVTTKRGRHLELVDKLNEVEDIKRIAYAIVGNNDVVTFDVEFKDMAAAGASFADTLNSEINRTRVAGMTEWWDLALAIENELLKVSD